MRDRSNYCKTNIKTICAKNGVPKTIVKDNAPEFCEKSSVPWLRKIGWMPYKTPLYNPQSNDIEEKMVQTVKMGLKEFPSFNQSIEAYIPYLLLS